MGQFFNNLGKSHQTMKRNGNISTGQLYNLPGTELRFIGKRSEDTLVIFQEYNQPHKPVRVFTYLIGREISDLEAAKWMACENKGQ